jgi:hypothetical protein
MANGTQTTLTNPVNGAFALSAIKAANTSQAAAQDVTAKLIALRKELETLRAERDAARFRVEDLEAQTSRLHRDLQRNSMATSVLRTCPRRLPRSLAFVAALVLIGMASWAAPARAQSFNCRHAKLPAEVAICQSPELRALDSEMATDYFSLDVKRPGNQARWLRRRNACGYNEPCLRAAYKDWQWGYIHSAYGE